MIQCFPETFLPCWFDTRFACLLEANINFSTQRLQFLLLPPYPNCKGCLFEIFSWEKSWPGLRFWFCCFALTLDLTFETTPNNMLTHKARCKSSALHLIFENPGKVGMMHDESGECGGSTAATPTAPFYLGASDHHRFLQPVLGLLSGLDWETAPVDITDQAQTAPVSSAVWRSPLSLPLGVWHTTDQAANIKPVRLLLQWVNWALRDDCKAMLSVNVDPTERLSLLISIALISLDIPEGFCVSV